MALVFLLLLLLLLLLQGENQGRGIQRVGSCFPAAAW
jgi:hypothetical protein